MSNQNQHGQSGNEANHSHHILPDSTAFKILGILLLLTVITVASAQVDLGSFNFALAMIIASLKASIVCMFFMGLKYDHKENTVIFSTSIIFMTIFMILTFGDLLTRGNVYVKLGEGELGSLTRPYKILPEGATAKKARFQKPWIATPEIIAAGKEQFLNQCISCHGPQGLGNGPASGGLNPKPRNFTSADNWKNGRKPSQIFGTLTKGLGGMPSFGSLGAEDRWTLVHYVRSLGPEGEKDSDEDLKKIGIDPNSTDGGAGNAEKVIPIDLAIEILSSPEKASAQPSKK